jgi:hypothetical protein
MGAYRRFVAAYVSAIREGIQAFIISARLYYDQQGLTKPWSRLGRPTIFTIRCLPELKFGGGRLRGRGRAAGFAEEAYRGGLQVLFSDD